jgi:hypothetical protein
LVIAAAAPVKVMTGSQVKVVSETMIQISDDEGGAETDEFQDCDEGPAINAEVHHGDP